MIDFKEYFYICHLNQSIIKNGPLPLPYQKLEFIFQGGMKWIENANDDKSTAVEAEASIKSFNQKFQYFCFIVNFSNTS